MEKKTKIVNFIKALIIIVLAVFITIGLSKLLVLKSEDGINQFDALYDHPDNSIDVIFLGSSLVYCDISTGVLWDNHGLAAFDLGGAEAPAWVSYYQLKEALRTQRPKVICYEVSIAGKYPMLTQSDEWSSDNAYGMKWNSNRIDQLKINSKEDEFLTRIDPFNIMHGRYKDLKENDFTNTRATANYKGFDPREEVVDMEVPDVVTEVEAVPCSEKAEEYTRKIIELAKSENIPIVLFQSPQDITESERQVGKYMEGIAGSEGVPYIDFNYRYDDIGLDFSRDMSSGHHLSYTGNYKFSDYFGKILKEMYDIPDRRGDSRYISWEWDSARQRCERNDLLLKDVENAGEIMNMTQSGYIVFVVSNEKACIFDDGEVVAEGENDFRLVYESGDDTFILSRKTLKGNDLISLYINDEEHLEFYGNILFVYDKVRHEYIKSLYF
ncbi:MAG: hypothetical protein K6F87_06855 [Lachnospiraceae bacterium]|nr:hypothetical protein [Lachnospiraceae bacterium]